MVEPKADSTARAAIAGKADLLFDDDFPVAHSPADAMDQTTNVIGAFSEEHAAELSGVSRRQLRRWNKIRLLRPTYGADATGLPYGRVYSFRDVVSLRVLGQLRNVHHVSERHLIEVQGELAKLSDEPWASRNLEVLGKRVVVTDGRHKREVVGGQRVFNIPLKIIIGSLRGAVAKLNERGPDRMGKVVRDKFIAEGRPVIAGTRIPVEVIKSFWEAGYTADQIISEYPGLTHADVEAAVAYQGSAAA